jgi:hypothetical protein
MYELSGLPVCTTSLWDGPLVSASVLLSDASHAL